MRRTTRRIAPATVLAAVVTAAVVAAAMVGVVPTAAAAAGSQTCKIVTAGGHRYSVSAQNVSCAFAEKWVTKVAGKRVSKANNTLSGGPSGYMCLASSNAGNALAKENHIATNVQRLGNCAKGSGFGKDPYFNWGIQYTSG